MQTSACRCSPQLILCVLFPCKEYQTKFIFRSKVNNFLLIKRSLDAKRRNMFRRTCFGRWLDLLYFEHEPYVIEYILTKQHQVDDAHYDMPLIYYVEGQSLHFGRPEFALITGFRFGTVSFGLYDSGEVKFRNRIFPHRIGLRVTNLDLIAVIEDEELFCKISDEDVVRVCLLLALEVIFMGRLLTNEVDDKLMRLVESLEAWNAFDAWESQQALPLEGSREAYNPHQAVYLIVVV
jgi:hypothetical protein